MELGVPSRPGGAFSIMNVAIFAFFVMVLLAPVLTLGSEGPGATQYTGEGSVTRQLGYGVVLAMALYGALRSERKAAALMLPWPILLALAWCWLSLTWAIDPMIALRRLALTSMVIWTTFIVVQGAGYERTILVVRYVMIAGLIGNYLTVFLSPITGIHLQVDSAVPTSIIGDWRGFMAHKNFAGAATAVCILLFLFDTKSIKWWLKLAVLLAAGFFLFKTQSKTSAGMLVMATAVGWVYMRYDRQIRTYAIPLILVFASLLLILDSAYQRIVLQTFFNAKSFTGRGLIWNAMLRYSEDNPIFGAGFGSFWNIGPDSPIYQYGQGFVKEVTVGHDGYLDLLVTVGVPGLAIIFFAAVIWPTWRLLVSPVNPSRGALTVALLLFCVGHNITESSLFARDALIGVIMMLAIALAQNWREVGWEPKKRSGGDVLAALGRRARGRDGSSGAAAGSAGR